MDAAGTCSRTKSVEVASNLLSYLFQGVVLRVVSLGGILLTMRGKRNCEMKITDATADHFNAAMAAGRSLIADAFQRVATGRAHRQRSFANGDFQRISRALPAGKVTVPFAL